MIFMFCRIQYSRLSKYKVRKEIRNKTMLICNKNEPGDNFQGDQTFREKVKMLILLIKAGHQLPV